MKDTLRTKGFEMDWFSFGEGEPVLVILPGMSLHSVMESEASVRHAYAALAKEYTIYLLERRNNMPDGFSVLDMAEDAAAAIEALGIGGCSVFGTSQGGMIALALAARHPSLVSKLVVCSTDSRPNDTIRSVIGNWAVLARSGDRIALNRDVFAHVYSPAFQERYEKALACLEDSGTPEELERFAILSDASVSFSIHDELGNIQCPVHVIGVRNDTVLSGEASTEIAATLGCDLKMYESTGHAIYDEDPGFISLLRTLLQG